MKKYILFIFFCMPFILQTPALAQPQNNNWCFGHRTGLNFSNGSPVFFENDMEVNEGSASVSDEAGNLLFYTSGSDVWDSNDNLMPNGAGLSGNTGSSANGVAIVKAIGGTSKYFIITTDQVESGLHNAYYSVVDMSLNGGLGDVIPAQSSILLTTDVIEGVRITPAENCEGYWIILHRHSNADYLAFRVDAAGINTTPVVSTGLPGFPIDPTYGNYGYMQFNNAYNRIVRAGGSKIETASFDKATGILSGFASIDPSPNTAYYAAFSPNDNLLYYAGYLKVCQANISLLPNIPAVQTSITEIGNGNYCGIRKGPDNKLYIMRSYTTYIARIDNPNTPGLACGLNPTALTFPPYSGPYPLPAFFYELGNHIVINAPDTIAGITRDTSVCFQEQTTLQGDPSYQSYHWSTGSTGATATVSQDGTYILAGLKDCKVFIDSFRVHFSRFTVNLGPDTNLCAGQTRTLDATLPGATYLWQNGSNSPAYDVTQTGTYSVAVSREGCTGYDTVQIIEVEPRLNILEPDTEICKGKPFIVHAVAIPASQFRWNNGSTTDETQITGAGTYTVTATSPCGILKDEIQITEIECNCTPFVPNAFSPNNDGKNEELNVKLVCPGLSGFYFAVYNRYGQRVFQSANPDMGWDGRQYGRQADAGTYFYYLKYKIRDTEYNKKGDITLLR